MATESTIPVPRELALPQTARRTLVGSAASFWSLTKPDINLLIAITVALGFSLAAHFPGSFPFHRLLNTMLGTLLVSSGAAALNQFIERRHDGLMRRTARRPVVLGGVSPRDAFLFGTFFSVTGIVYLQIFVNPLSVIRRGNWTGNLPRSLYSAQTCNAALYTSRRHLRSGPATHRMGGCVRIPPGRWRVDPVHDSVSLAVPPFHGDCMDVPGGLRSGGLQDPATMQAASPIRSGAIRISRRALGPVQHDSLR